jgi:hypothetical protein
MLVIIDNVFYRPQSLTPYNMIVEVPPSEIGILGVDAQLYI